MIKQFTVNVDFSQKESYNFAVQNVSTLPPTPVSGQLIFYTGFSLSGPGLYVWDSVQWLPASTTTGPINLIQYNHISLSYAQLLIKISNNEIEPGVFYLINDYKTHYSIEATPYFGAIEPIYVLGLSVNSVSIEAWSSVYTQDKLMYDINATIDEPFGRIIYREDTVNRLSAPYDWRVVQFRRWNLDGTELPGKYSAFDDSMSIIDTTLTVPSSLDFEDYYTFNDSVGTNCYNVHIKRHNTQRHNNILFRGSVKDVTVDDDCENMTFVGNVENVLIGRSSQNNILISDIDTFFTKTLFVGNLIKGNILNVNVLNTFTDNEMSGISNSVIGSFFRYNQIGIGFNSNNIKDDFQSNVIGSGFESNHIISGFTNNTIGIDFKNNVILHSNFSNNTIGDTVNSNTFTKEFADCVIPNGFVDNQITTKCNLYDFTYLNTLSNLIFSNSESNMEVLVNVPITNQLDLNDYGYAGIIRVSNNSTIDSIINPPNHSFEIIPESGVTLTLESVPHTSAISGDIVMADEDYSIILNGNAGDWMRLRKDSSNRLKQVDGQIYL